MPLEEAKKELKYAKQALSSMKSTNKFDDYEMHWKHFLAHCVTTWNKISDECNTLKKSHLIGTEEHRRKKEPLLVYIHQARNANEHSIKQITEKQPSSIGIKHADNKVFIKSMQIRPGHITIEGDPMTVISTSGKITAIAVLNQGVTFEVPTKFGGKGLTKKGDPIEIAEHGISFYEQSIETIESKINKKPGMKITGLP